MDVYTAPPENSYRIWTRFSFPSESGTVAAISTTASQYPFIAASYTIIIQLCFAFFWQVTAQLCLLRRPRNRQEWMVMTAIRNASEPWTACGVLLWCVFRHLAGGPRNRQELGLITLLSVPAVVLAVGSVVTALLYTESMRLGNAAPVSPSSVFVPYVSQGEALTPTAYKLSSYYQPSVLRALGSAESVDDSTRRSSVRVSKQGLPPSHNNSATQPGQRISYDYIVSAYELGLQNLAGFSIEVQGSCFTEYGWLRTVQGDATGLLDEYVFFDDETNTLLVAGPKQNTPDLTFFAIVDRSVDSVLNVTNQTYALVATTAVMGSFTPSNDPWYFTELATGGPTYKTAGAPYRVAPGRPVLSCWEDTVFCFNREESKKCSNIWKSGLPKGLIGQLSARLAVPMIVTIGSGAGISVLRAYSGVGAGMLLDATSSTMFADVERMVLAAFLATKEILRDSALLGRLAGTSNLLEKPDGSLKDGADNFVLRTGDVVAVRFDLILLAPIGTAVALLAVLAIDAFKRLRGLKKSPWALRGILLSATQLFRLVDMRISNSAWDPESTKALMPRLKSPESELSGLEAVWEDTTGARMKSVAAGEFTLIEEASTATAYLLHPAATEDQVR